VIKESLVNFKFNQNNNENYKLCQECEANNYCNKCPKFLMETQILVCFLKQFII